MQKTDHYKEINFQAGHRVTGGRVYAYFVSTMERLLMKFCLRANSVLFEMILSTSALSPDIIVVRS